MDGKNILGLYMNLKMLDREDVFWHFFHSLSRERQQKLETMKAERSRRCSLGAWVLFDYGLRQLYGLREREVQIAYGAQGKPYVKDVPDIYFNLSHSGDFALAAFALLFTRVNSNAFAPAAIGCDIQKTAEKKERVAARFFSEAEQRAVADGMDFYRIWARKESYIKCIGDGMACDLRSFDVVTGWPSGVVSSMADRSADGAVCHFAEHFMPGYALALCYQYEETLPVIWQEVHPEQLMKL